MQQKFFKPLSVLKNTPMSAAAELRERAMRLPRGPERDQLLSDADQLDGSARTEAYLKSHELKPPT